MADLKINQLDPIINPLQDNDLFVVKMKIRGTAIADEDRKVTWLEVKQALNLGQYMPTIGGDFTGNVRLNNNVPLQGKSTSNTSIQIAKVNTDNNIEFGSLNSTLFFNSQVIPVYYDGSNSYDFITRKNLPVPGDINAYTKSEVDTKLNTKLNLTGGTLSGNLIFNNNRGVQGKTTGASTINLVSISSADVVEVGYHTQKMNIRSLDVPNWHNGTNSYKIITESNLPSPSDINAYTKSEVDSALNNKFNVSGGTLTGDITMLNGKSIYMNDSTGTARQILTGNSAGNLWFGDIRFNLKFHTNAQPTVHVGTDPNNYQIYHQGNKPTTSDLGLTDTVSKAATALQPGDYGIGGQAPAIDDADFLKANFNRKSQLFRQLGTTSQSRFGGSGIGLHIFYDNADVGSNIVTSANLFMRTDGVTIVERSVADSSTGVASVSKMNTLYGTLNPPTPGELGDGASGSAYTKSEVNNKFAQKGVNSDITALNALTGSLKVGANATQPLEVTTLQQVQAMTSGTAGAVVGVVGGFIGAVMWFNGSRSTIPAGWVAADGQTLLKADYPDLWAAVNSGALFAVTEASWQSQAAARGAYAKDTSATTFRVMDLNGEQAGSVGGLFLRGNSTALNSQVGGVATVSLNAAPNITGTFPGNAWGAMGAPQGAFTLGTPAVNIPVGSGSTAANYLSFNAALSHAAYGRNSSEVRPNSVVGIWIIRASNTFAAANTTFTVYDGAVATPAANAIITGGNLKSTYSVAGNEYISLTMSSKMQVGKKPSVAFTLRDNSGNITNYQIGGTRYAGGPIPLDGLHYTWEEAAAAGFIFWNPQMTNNSTDQTIVSLYPDRMEIRGILRPPSGQNWSMLNGIQEIYSIPALPPGKTKFRKPFSPAVCSTSTQPQAPGFTRSQNTLNQWVTFELPSPGQTIIAGYLIINDTIYFDD